MIVDTLDTPPRALADLVDGLAQGVDREAARVLLAARGAALPGRQPLGGSVNWQSERRAMRCALKRRHQGHREASHA